MKNAILFFIGIIIIGQCAFAQYPTNVNNIDAKPNTTTTFTGNLSKGEKIEDLTWAENSAVACFPGTQNKKFT